MRSAVQLFVAVLTVLAAPGLAKAGQVIPLEYAELTKRSEVMVLGHVASTKRISEHQDIATVDVVTLLKGQVTEQQFEVQVRCRGESGFDPQLEKGDKGVFFLKKVAGRKATLAYTGSIALFPAPYCFKITAVKNQDDGK